MSASSTSDASKPKGKELVVERHSNTHVFDSYFYVVNGRFHWIFAAFKPKKLAVCECAYLNETTRLRTN